MSDRRYIRDTVADDFKHNWQTELEKREAWLNGVEDIREILKGTEFFDWEIQHEAYLVEALDTLPNSIGGYDE